jgi:ribosomal protein L12E/L44/L45/RPP1/RPP2
MSQPVVSAVGMSVAEAEVEEVVSAVMGVVVEVVVNQISKKGA